jgi:hypothetical protein
MRPDFADFPTHSRLARTDSKRIKKMHFLKGMVAGLAATVVLSALMVMKAMIGLMPQLDLPKMIVGLMGQPDNPMLGWIGHFMIGIVGYGIAIALFGAKEPGQSNVARGMFIAIGGWLVMMVVMMPMAGAGLFGMNMGIMAPVMTLVLHLIFGAVLGGVFGAMVQRERVAYPAR